MRQWLDEAVKCPSSSTTSERGGESGHWGLEGYVESQRNSSYHIDTYVQVKESLEENGLRSVCGSSKNDSREEDVFLPAFLADTRRPWRARLTLFFR